MAIVVIEFLESRTLMADMTGALAAQVAVDVGAVKASVSAAAATSKADQRILKTALHPVSKPNAALLKTLGKDYKAALANLHVMQKIAATIGSDTKRAASAVQSAIAHKLTAKSVAKMNAALAKLSVEDNLFVSASVVNAFYTATAAPGTDETQIGSSNPTNTALGAALPAIETDASNLSNTPYAKFNTLVMDVSAFATYVTTNVTGAVFP